MATSYTSLLGLALPVTGELSGTWGDTVNNSITSLLDSAIAGTTTLSTDADVTLTTTTGAANTAREAILLCSGARTALRTITAPAQSKIYTVINSTTGGFSVKVVGAGPTTGVTIVAGTSAQIAWNGSDFVLVSTLTSAGVLPTANGGTGLTSFTANGVVYASSSSALATGSALVFDGTNLGIGGAVTLYISGANKGLAIAGTTNGAEIDLKRSGGTGTSYLFQGADDSLVLGNQSSSPIKFYLSDTEQMRLTTTGLGIGTSSPQLKFVVSNGGASGVEVSPTGGNQGGTYLQSYNRSGTAFVATEIIASKIGFYTGTSPAFAALLDSSGNLGLGVTPSAWASGWRTLQIGAGANFIGRTGVVNQLQLVANGYYNGTNYIYQNTGEATQYFQTGGYHAWGIAASGTAGNAITFTQAMTLDASGNLGVGTTSPINNSGYGGFSLNGTNGALLSLLTNGTESSRIASVGNETSIQSKATTGYITFVQGVSGGTERARIDSSGQLLVGLTSGYATASVQSYQTSAGNWAFGAKSTASAGSTYFITFNTSDGTQRGYIYYNGVATVYSTSSDQRLKNNIVDAPSAVSDISAIKIRSFDWKENGQHQKYGVVAQELQTIAPDAISTPPEKNGMLGVDYSLLVPMMIKSIQEQQALIETLTTRLTALEGKA